MRILQRSAYAAMAAGLLCAQTAAAQTQENWKTWNAGALTFEAPARLRVATDTTQGLKPLEFGHPDWHLKIVGSQTDQNALAVLFEYSPNVIDGISGTRELARAPAIVDGRPAQRLDWRDGDMNWTGFDLIVRDLTPGHALFKFACHSGDRSWRTQKPACDRIASSIKIVGEQPHAAPSVPVVQQGPQPDQSGRTSAPSTEMQIVDEPAFGFALRIPAGWDFKRSEANGQTTWGLANRAPGNDLLIVTVASIEQAPGVDPVEKFHDLVNLFAAQDLSGGVVTEFGPFRMGALNGFSARATGHRAIGSDPAAPVSAIVLLLEVGNRHVLAAAVAPVAAATLLDEIGQPGAIFGPSPSNPAAPPDAGKPNQEPDRR